MKYLPFLQGPYSVAPGLIPIARQENADDRLLFQIDHQYDTYLSNKLACRRENLHKYYSEADFEANTCETVNEFILQQLLDDYPERFTLTTSGDRTVLQNLHTAEIIIWRTTSMEMVSHQYETLFDALCSQVQEDVAVCQLTEDRDWVSAIHLCAPNHWAPGEKIGRPFDQVHQPVPGMEKTMPHYRKMLDSVLTKGPFTRFAWGISTDSRLNHHPEPPEGVRADFWYGRKMERGMPLFIRTEKQNLVGFPAVNAFLFTIRTFFYPVSSFSEAEKTALWAAVEGMSPESLRYKGLTGITEILADNLFGQ